MQGKSKTEAVLELLSLRRVVTFMLAATFCYMAVMGIVTLEQFLPVFTTVIGYYFGANVRDAEIAPKDKEEDA